MREVTPFAGVDIGTSTVRCVIGRMGQDSPELSVIGHGEAPNRGMRKGVVSHIEDVTEAIAQAVGDAERLAGVRLQGATINVNGAHVGGVNSRGVIAISNANHEITAEDRMRVEDAAAILRLPSNREIIQVFAQNYRLDGQENIKDPVGMQGIRLEVDTHIVTAATPNMRSLTAAVEKAGLQVHNYTLSSLAAAETVLQRQQKEAGTVLVDIGASTTNLVVFEDGEVQHVAVIPMGGQHITNDLAIGLRTELDAAEAVKVHHATLSQSGLKRSVRLKVDGKDYTFKSEDIALITEARVEEIFEHVNKELVRIKRAHKLPGGVVLVGGTSKLPGIADFAKEFLQLAARIGSLQRLDGLTDVLDSQTYAAATGLMLLDTFLAPVTHTSSAGAVGRTLSFLDKFSQKFRR